MFKNKFFLVLILVAVVLPFVSSLLNYYTDWLFFVETGFASVFTTTLYAKTGVGFLFGMFLCAVIMVNLVCANRAQFPYSGISIVGGGNFRVNRNDAIRFVKPLAILATVILSLLAASWGALRWEEVLLFTNRVDVGTVDPVIGKDIGFYLFSLPFWEILNGFAGFALVAAAAVSGVV